MSISQESARQIFMASLPTDLPDKPQPNKLSLRGLLRLCLSEIKDARKAGYDWQVIASSLEKVAHEKFNQTEMQINPKTVKSSYYLLTRSKNNKNKKRRKREPTFRKHDAPVPAQAAQPSAPDKPPKTVPASEPKSEVEELRPNRFRDRFKTVINPKTTTGYENCKSL